MYIHGEITKQTGGIGWFPQALGQNPNPDNMPTNPLVPRKWCPALSRVKSDACFPYADQEISISRTTAGHLTPDVVLVQPGGALGTIYYPGRPVYVVSCAYLIIRDFGVNWRHVKPAAKAEQLLKDWLNRFETDKSLAFRISGYSDCVGAERNNFLLRRGRARNIFRLLGKSARSRVLSVAAAPSQNYLTDNSTIAARANNRSVVIEIFTGGVQST